MTDDQTNIENILVRALSHMLKRTIELNYRDQLAIAQEYREWINCISESDFSKQEIIFINKNKLE
tara:strand:+ start:1155 stop:1349 length:195 start_codon:yes stop_codon:yes gene_type:complete